MSTESTIGPDDTAVRVALWRATHVQVDNAPHVFEDEIGLQLVAPADGWQRRPDLNPEYTRSFRASIVARARFIEDLVLEAAESGVDQYVLLGAGLDTFAQRRPDVAARFHVFEIDRPEPQSWKQRRLAELGYERPDWLRFVSVNFEATSNWLQPLKDAGFDSLRPAVVASTGVSMYLTKSAIANTLREFASFAAGSTFAMTFLVPLEFAHPDVRPGLEMAVRGARANGTPFISFFTPAEMLSLARDCGLADVEHVSANDLAERYFAGRPDGLRPPENAEEFLVART